MKNLVLLLLAMASPFCTLFGQYQTITFEEELLTFNGNQALPAEQDLLLTGSIGKAIQLVELELFSAKGKEGREPLYTRQWVRPQDNQGTTFKVPLTYKLHAGKEYDFVIRQYAGVNETSKKELYRQVTAHLDAYLNQTFRMDKKNIELDKKPKQVLADMDQIVSKGLAPYRSPNQFQFAGFSDLVKGQLKNIDDTNVAKATKRMEEGKTTTNAVKYRSQMIDELKKLINAEVRFVLNNEWAVLSKEYRVEDYSTEKRNGYFSINFGYGVAYLEGDLDNLSYGASPYIGIGLPLTTSSIAPRFLRNASVTLGVFTKNFEDAEGEEVTGPIVKKPIYLGLDYKLFQFVRFNAGATVLETANGASGQLSDLGSRVFVRPFIGLSAKINLSIGLDK